MNSDMLLAWNMNISILIEEKKRLYFGTTSLVTGQVRERSNSTKSEILSTSMYVHMYMFTRNFHVFSVLSVFI